MGHRQGTILHNRGCRSCQTFFCSFKKQFRFGFVLLNALGKWIYGGISLLTRPDALRILTKDPYVNSDRWTRLISQCARDALGASRHVGIHRRVKIVEKNTVLYRDWIGLKGRRMGDAIGRRSP